MRQPLKRSWVEISLKQIQINYKICKNSLPKKTSIMAVVKADAYGHGDIEVAKALQDIGVDLWAVSNIEEACRLRNHGIQGDILILGYTPIENLECVAKNGITQAILSTEYAEAVLKTKIKIKCQFAIDTGMNRIGLNAEEPEKCIKLIRDFDSVCHIDGIFTHLCVADSTDEKHQEFTKEQIDKFETIADGLIDLNINHIHCMNSAGGLWHNTKYNAIARLGIILYGLKPDSSNILPTGIKPALQWKSVVSMVKSVNVGETIGYGCTFKAYKPMVVATVPTGYADGYNRMLSNKGHVIINGENAPIVGRVCMDQFMIDVTYISNVEMGTEVLLLSTQYNADNMANDTGTIGYEIICNISKRVPRIYND